VGHEHNVDPGLDFLLVLNGVAVHGAINTEKNYEVWPAEPDGSGVQNALATATVWNTRAIKTEFDSRGFWVVKEV
jgi:hypothetical protein